MSQKTLCAKRKGVVLFLLDADKYSVEKRKLHSDVQTYFPMQFFYHMQRNILRKMLKHIIRCENVLSDANMYFLQDAKNILSDANTIFHKMLQSIIRSQ